MNKTYNILKVPYGLKPEEWERQFIIACSQAYNLMDNGVYILKSSLTALYNSFGVLLASKTNDWMETVPLKSSNVTMHQLYNHINMTGSIKKEEGITYHRLAKRFAEFAIESKESMLFADTNGESIDYCENTIAELFKENKIAITEDNHNLYQMIHILWSFFSSIRRNDYDKRINNC